MHFLGKVLAALAIIFVIFVIVVVLSACKVSGMISEWEREHETDSL